MNNNEEFLYKIDIQENNKWVFYEGCYSIEEVCETLKRMDLTQQDFIRILKNDCVIQFLNSNEFSINYFINRYIHNNLFGINISQTNHNKLVRKKDTNE